MNDGAARMARKVNRPIYGAEPDAGGVNRVRQFGPV